MATAIKVLGQKRIGQVQSDNALLTSDPVPTGKVLLVKSVRMSNLDASVSRTATVYYWPANASGNKRQISPLNMPIPAKQMVILDDEFVLMAGDSLRLSFGETGTEIIDIVVAGIERDQT